MTTVCGEPCGGSSGKHMLGWEREGSDESVRAARSSCSRVKTQDKKGSFFCGLLLSVVGLFHWLIYRATEGL